HPLAVPPALSLHDALPISDRGKRSLGLRFSPIPRQVRDGDHHQAVRLAEPDEIRDASHGAVIVDDLANHARGVQAREMGEIDGRDRKSTRLKSRHQISSYA